MVEQGRILLAGPRPAIDSEDPGPAGFDGLIADDAGNGELLLTGAELYSTYAGAFVEDPARAKRLSLRVSRLDGRVETKMVIGSPCK